MNKIQSLVGTAEAVVAGTFLVLMVVLIFIGGVARLMHYPQNWTIDLATCLFAWACFFAADIAWRRNSMMAVDVVVEKLPERLQFALRMLNYALIAAFLLYLAYYGFTLSWISRIRSFQGMPGVSYSWVTMSLPVGAVLLLITTAMKVRAELSGAHEDNRAVDVL
ncbi:TRAP transporter small permease [Aquabacter sp. CN5-332]|uniref:TRAP transporter small permease n=1 Tax=Aquabacter sp. CN5-332 TaxID=3156608 RepID=UPI0032B35984